MDGDGRWQRAQIGRPGAPGGHELIGEAECYLAAFDLFRSLGHEPSWRREEAGQLPRSRRHVAPH